MRIHVNVAEIIALFLRAATLPLPLTVGNDNDAEDDDDGNDDDDDNDDDNDNNDNDDNNRLFMEIVSTPENVVHDNPTQSAVRIFWQDTKYK